LQPVAGCCQEISFFPGKVLEKEEHFLDGVLVPLQHGLEQRVMAVIKTESHEIGVVQGARPKCANLCVFRRSSEISKSSRERRNRSSLFASFSSREREERYT
jgi:hypothetical protein